MRYFGFLARFVVLPLFVITLLIRRDRARGRHMPAELTSWQPEAVINALSAVAVAYTTVWDNYIIYKRVWWYDPKLVTGTVIGYVPIEEYTFFVLQTLMTGRYVQWIARRIPTNDEPYGTPMGQTFRWGSTAALAAVWARSTAALLRGKHEKHTYLTLLLSWALPPVILQTAFGGDILWKHRRLVAAGIIPATLYLGAADSVAIKAGTWVINPEKSVDTLIAGRLPLEEGLFFLLTNTLITFGATLVWAHESEKRIPPAARQFLHNLKQRFNAAYKR